MPFNHKANLASCLESLRKSIVPRWDKYFADKTTNTGFDFYHSDSPAVQLDFIQCPFPNQIQFGLEKLHPKIAYNFPNQFQFGLERKKMILQDADSKPNSDWFGKFWWPLSMSWKFQTKFSLVWKNHWLNTQSWTASWLIVTHLPLDNLALLRGLCGALVSRGLKALFLHLSRALLGILGGALLLCHLIIADLTLNIAALLGGLHWTSTS